MTSKEIREIADKNLRQKVSDFLVQEIATNKAHREQIKKCMQEDSAHLSSASLNGLWSLAYIVYDNNEDMLTTTQVLFESVFAIFDDYSERMVNIEKKIQTIADNTGVDLSEMKTQVAKIKEAVEAPIYKYVKTQQENEEKRKKLEDELLDWAIRSH
jgi:hypothetical protein